VGIWGTNTTAHSAAYLLAVAAAAAPAACGGRLSGGQSMERRYFGYAEVQAGVIAHAVGFTNERDVPGTFPSRDARSGRLCGLVAADGASLKKYGMMLADNGSNFYLTGETNTNWDDNDLAQIKTVPAGAFEVVTTGPVLP
jgi:hypothetical protein